MREVERARPGELEGFWRSTEREALSTLYNFRVIWHEQMHEIVVRDGTEILAAARVRIAASLAHLDAFVVLPQFRRGGFGRLLTSGCEEVANYYNCHKVSVAVPHASGAQRFFERCGYREEAILAQHTFKLDVAMLRKFLL